MTLGTCPGPERAAEASPGTRQLNPGRRRTALGRSPQRVGAPARVRPPYAASTFAGLAAPAPHGSDFLPPRLWSHARPGIRRPTGWFTAHAEMSTSSACISQPVAQTRIKDPPSQDLVLLEGVDSKYGG